MSISVMTLIMKAFWTFSSLFSPPIKIFLSTWSDLWMLNQPCLFLQDDSCLQLFLWEFLQLLVCGLLLLLQWWLLLLLFLLLYYHWVLVSRYHFLWRGFDSVPFCMEYFLFCRTNRNLLLLDSELALKKMEKAFYFILTFEGLTRFVESFGGTHWVTMRYVGISLL